MKKFLIFLVVAVFPLTAFSQNKTQLVQKSSVTTNATLTTIQQARVLIQELNKELTDAKTVNEGLKEKIKNALFALDEGKKETNLVKKNADLLRDWGINQQNLAFEWMEKHDKMQKRYHFLKNLTGIIAAIYGFTFGIYCMRYVPPVYSAYAFALPIVTAIIAFFAVWLVL